MDTSITNVIRAVEISASPKVSELDRNQATRYLEQLKLHPDILGIALSLFNYFKYDNNGSAIELLPLLFSLQLFRVYLNTSTHTSSTRLDIRQSLLNRFVKEHSLYVDTLITNGIAHILTICLKYDYPEIWPTAFDDIFYFSSLSANGLHLVITVLYEIDQEIVMYNDNRNTNEVTHNMIIKDEMRQGGDASVVAHIVLFLYTTSYQCIQHQKDTTKRCLHILVEYIGWIDINLSINNNILVFIYSCLNDNDLISVACKYLLEIVKKGMDIDSKVHLLESINIVPILSQIQIPATNTHNYEIYEDLCDLVDTLYLTLIGHFQKAEENIIEFKLQDSSLDTELKLLSRVGVLMTNLFPLILHLIKYMYDDNICAIMPSLNRYTSLLKQQLKYKINITNLVSHKHITEYFLAESYVNELLVAVLKQMQYDEDFDFNSNDEEELLVMKTKKEIRKLFINCCRVKADSCLELILAAFQSLEQPISKAHFPPLDAALRLLHAFAECGSVNDNILNSDAISQLVNALHQSDIRKHSHSQVLLSYFEVSVRYVKQCSEEGLLLSVEAMVVNGLGHKDRAVHSKSAASLLKALEAISTRSAGSAPVFLPLIITLGEYLFTEQTTNASSYLTHEAELQLVEAIGLVVATDIYKPVLLSRTINIEEYKAMQNSILNGIINSLISKVNIILNSTTKGYIEDYSDLTAHYINCLTSLSKSYTDKSITSMISSSFLHISQVIVSLLKVYKCIESVRCKVTAFYHRMTCILFKTILPDICLAIPILVDNCTSVDIETIVQLVNQTMTDFSTDSLVLIRESLFPLINKINNFCAIHIVDELIPPHVEVELVRLQKLYCSIILHLFTSSNYSILLDNTNHTKTYEIYFHLISILKGPSYIINKESKLSLIKAVLNVLVEMCKKWKNDVLLNEFNTPCIVEDALPYLLRSFIDGTFNIKDAQTGSVFIDIGGLIWTLCDAKGNAVVSNYLISRVLPQIGWNTRNSEALVHLIGSSVQINIFKDEFKKIVKS